MQSLKQFARTLKHDIHAVYLASKDRRTPWYARALAIVIVAYALSPIDLIPDFIPILGYLDDLILVPLGLWLVIKLIPSSLFAEYRAQAELAKAHRKPNGMAAGAIVVLWLLLGVAIAFWLKRVLKR